MNVLLLALAVVLAPEGGPYKDVTVKRDPNGVPVERKHGGFTWLSDTDALGRIRRTYGSGSQSAELSTHVEYDAAGRETHAVDDVLNLEEWWEYGDVLGRRTEYRRIVQPGGRLFRETRSYEDKAGVEPGTAGTHKVLITEYADDVSGTPTKTALTLDDAGRLLERREYLPAADGSNQPSARTFSYDARGNVLTETFPVGDGSATLASVYDAAGYLIEKREPSPNGLGQQSTVNVTDAGGLVVETSGPRTDDHWRFKHDGVGRLVEKELVAPSASPGAQGGVWTYAYRLADATVQETDPLGYVTKRTFNARKLVLKEVRSGGGGERTRTLEYNGPWLATETTQEGSWKNVVKRPRYDLRGRVLLEQEDFTGPAGGYTYELQTGWAGRAATTIQRWSTANRGGSRTGYVEVDSLDNVIARGWAGYNDKWSYRPDGRLALEQPAGKPETTYGYVEGAPIWRRFADEETRFQYWPSGKVRKITDPAGRERRQWWSWRGGLSREEFGSTSDYDLTAYTFDGAGNVETKTVGRDADTAVWRYAYGPRGELLSVEQPSGGKFQYEHDALGQLVSITPPAGGSAGQTFDHDYLGRQTLRTRGGASWITTWADGASTTSDLAGAKTITDLDGRGRPLRVRFQGPGDLVRTTLEYDPMGQVLAAVESRTSGDVSTELEYGDLRRLVTKITRGVDRVEYGYTASGQKAWMKSNAGQVDYGYDPATDRLATITAGARETAVAWEPGGARVSDIRDTTVRECRRYDVRGRVRKIENVPGWDTCDRESAMPDAQYTYMYDERGNRTREDYLERQASETTLYGYDASDRLTGVLYTGGAATLYALGDDGSRLGEKHVSPYGGSLGPDGYTTASGVEYVYGYDRQGAIQSITSDGATVAQYDVDIVGHVHREVRAEAQKDFTWDAGGRMTGATITRTVAGTGSAPEAYAYTYDYAGRRVAKSGPSGSFRYLWGAEGLAEEIIEAPTGDQRMQYERDGDLVTAINGERLLHDGLGSVVGRAGTGTAVLYRYDAWGNFRDAAAPRTGEATLAYAGQHWDADLGLSYAQQRWYDPGVGRFLSEDPVGVTAERIADPAGLHAFGYANGNPLLYVDPEGLDAGTGAEHSARDNLHIQLMEDLEEELAQKGSLSAREIFYLYDKPMLRLLYQQEYTEFFGYFFKEGRKTCKWSWSPLGFTDCRTMTETENLSLTRYLARKAMNAPGGPGADPPNTYTQFFVSTKSRELLPVVAGLAAARFTPRPSPGYDASDYRTPTVTGVGQRTAVVGPVPPAGGAPAVVVDATAAERLDVRSVLSNPRSLWGRSAQEIAHAFKEAGYTATVRQSTRGSTRAQIVEIKGHKEITQIQVHPGGGRHGGAYVKVSTTRQGILKVVDPDSYKPLPGEKSKIVKSSTEPTE